MWDPFTLCTLLLDRNERRVPLRACHRVRPQAIENPSARQFFVSAVSFVCLDARLRDVGALVRINSKLREMHVSASMALAVGHGGKYSTKR